MRLLLALLFSSVYVLAQGTTSRVLGLVQDPTGAAVPGATVQLTNEATGAVFTTRTSETGAYVFEAVQSGRYTITVEAAGFKRFVSRGNEVTIGQPTTVNVKLEVGALVEQIEVSASYELVQTSTSGNIGNLFTDRMIRDLPLVGTRGRNPLTLVLLQPGVVSGANTGGGVHVHGARDRAWNFTLDGIDINETSAGGSNFSPLRTNPDSLAEFRVLTSSFTADYGRNSGGQVTMITRSGSNEFHGSAFWFYRTPRLNANEWENNLNGVGKRQFVQHIWGGSLGGPIVRNKTFFFANVQLLRALQTGLVNRTVYTAEARRGILRYVRGGRNRPAGVPDASVDAAGNVLPGVNIGTYNVATSDPERFGLDKTIQALLAQTPLPNNFMGGDGLNTALFTFTAAEKEKQHDAIIKVDHIFNERNTVFARIAFGQQNTFCDSANSGQPMFPGTRCLVDTYRTPKNLAANWRWNPSPSVTNELVFGFNRFTFDFQMPNADLNKVTMYGPVAIDAEYSFGNKRQLHTWQFVDNFAWFRGSHALKFGTNLRYQQHVDVRGSIAGQNATQAVNFSTAVNTVDPATFGLPPDLNVAFDRPAFQSHINFLLGRVGNITRGFPSRGDQFIEGLYDFDARYPEYDFYAQDTWKVRKNLTVDLGLRWELKLAPRNPGDRITHPDQLVQAGAPATQTLKWIKGTLFDNSLHNLGPSVGIAWDPTGSGKNSVRVNYRIAYDRLNTFVLSSSIFQNLPGQTQGVNDTSFGQAGGRLTNLPRLKPPSVKPSELAQPAPFSNNLITVVDPQFKMPTTHMWSLSIQREIAHRTVLDVTYIGRRAYHLFGAYDANQAEIFRNGFLEAFKVVKAGGESDLMNRLLRADSRLRPCETGSQMVRRLYASTLDLNSVAALAASIATRLQGTPARSVTDLSGMGPFFFIPFPQFGGGMRVIDSNDFSTYHTLEIQVERRFSGGLHYQVSYTWAKSLDTRSYDPAFTVVATANAQSASSTPFDIYNRRLNYARSDFDRRHVLQSNWSWELPVGKRRKWGTSLPAVADAVVGGWQLTGYLRLTSGRPFTVYSGSYTFGSIQQSPANCSGCDRSMGQLFDDPASGLKWYLDQAERAKFSIPAPGEFGNTGRNFLEGPGFFNMDLAVLKRFGLRREGFELEVRGDFTNLTNSPSFGFPTATITSTIFGRVHDSVVSSSRKIQLGAKVYF
ncbi:MAG: carboxypeptidase regulatory-like domain-containing protein [Bryobacteraceae bacterium]